MKFIRKQYIKGGHIYSITSWWSKNWKRKPHRRVYWKNQSTINHSWYTHVGSRYERQCSTSGKGDVRLSFPCKAARCWNHQIFPRATGPCLTAVWTLKRGDNLISTHVNTAAGAKRKLWAYCVSVISSCILWPQEWKIFKWLWCPGSCWTALMVWKHLSFLDAHLSLCLYPFILCM